MNYKTRRTYISIYLILGFQVVLVVKNLLADTGGMRDVGLVPGSGRSSGGGHGKPVQYSCLENPMDRRAWWATVHRVTKSWPWLKQLGRQHANGDSVLWCFGSHSWRSGIKSAPQVFQQFYFKAPNSLYYIPFKIFKAGSILWTKCYDEGLDSKCLHQLIGNGYLRQCV